MKLTIEGIKDRAAWEKAGIALPGYDVEKVSQKAKEEPKNRDGFILESVIFSVFLSVELQTDFWKKVYWTEESPV